MILVVWENKLQEGNIKENWLAFTLLYFSYITEYIILTDFSHLRCVFCTISQRLGSGLMALKIVPGTQVTAPQCEVYNP